MRQLLLAIASLFVVCRGNQVIFNVEDTSNLSNLMSLIYNHPKAYNLSFHSNRFLISARYWRTYDDEDTLLHSINKFISDEREHGALLFEKRMDFVPEEYNDNDDELFSVYVITANKSAETVLCNMLKDLLDDQRVLAIESDKDTYAAFSQQLDSAMWNLGQISNPNGFGISSSYNYNYTGKGIIVHVLDTGVNLEHVEFENRAKLYYVPDKYKGECYMDTDCNGHGTHVAGIVAGKFHGIAKKALIYASKVLSKEGKGTTSDIIEALYHIAKSSSNVGSVVNMSLGGSNSYALNKAIEMLTRTMSITVVVAAGNSKQDACNEGPADSPEAITVGSHDRNGKRSGFSNFGRCVDIYAPGDIIRSAGIKGPRSYRLMSGTSMATPAVAGIVAQMLERNPSYSPKEIKESLRRTAKTQRVFDYVSGSNLAASSVIDVPCGRRAEEAVCLAFSGSVNDVCSLNQISVSEHKDHGSCTINYNQMISSSLWFYKPFFKTFRDSNVRVVLYESQELENTPARMNVTVRHLLNGAIFNKSAAFYPVSLEFEAFASDRFEFEIAVNAAKSMKSDVPFAFYIEAPRHCKDVYSGDTVCSGNGDCDENSGLCSCKDDYEGADCSQSTWELQRRKYRGWWYKWLLDIEPEWQWPSVVFSLVVLFVIWLPVLFIPRKRRPLLQ